MSPSTAADLVAPPPTPKGHELRALTSPATPRSGTAVGVAFAIADYLLFFAGSAAAILAPWWSLKAVGVVVSGIAVAMLFALAHDAAHGSLAGSRGMNRLLATICFLPSWYPYTPWIRGHNHLHHGWTNVAECDYSWRPVSPADYHAMPRWRRAIEQVYRSWWGLWLHSIVEIWWKHMAMPRESDRRYLDARHLAADRALVAATVAAAVALCWWVAPQWATLAGGPALPPWAIAAAVVVVPWWIFHVMFSVVTFLHHTHPSVPWFRTKQESNYFKGQVQATVHVTLPTWLERLLHNITVHGAHHVDPRIPFRRLPQAQRRLESALAADVIIERWSLRSFIAVTRVCELYDYEAGGWCTFRTGAVRQTRGASVAAPEPTGVPAPAGGSGTTHERL